MISIHRLGFALFLSILGFSLAMDDTPFRRCGAQLLRHIMDNNLCRPDKCHEISKRDTEAATDAASVALLSRLRRSPDTKVITDRCCHNMCRPSEIRDICCGRV